MEKDDQKCPPSRQNSCIPEINEVKVPTCSNTPFSTDLGGSNYCIIIDFRRAQQNGAALDKMYKLKRRLH